VEAEVPHTEKEDDGGAKTMQGDRGREPGAAMEPGCPPAAIAEKIRRGSIPAFRFDQAGGGGGSSSGGGVERKTPFAFGTGHSSSLATAATPFSFGTAGLGRCSRQAEPSSAPGGKLTPERDGAVGKPGSGEGQERKGGASGDGAGPSQGAEEE